MWMALLYGIAAVIALRSLFRLMDQHRRAFRYRLQVEQYQKEQELLEQQASEALESTLEAAANRVEQNAA
ncbi:MAG: hypothetical protein KDA78_16275 [Planctomycetaceae bacterium]|nr:hypothetical protein [Planctomycetaceae bacterium]